MPVNSSEEHFGIDHSTNSNEPGKTVDTVKLGLRTVFFDDLKKYYEMRKKYLRKMQCESFEAFIELLEKGGREGLIKLPMGTGKTRLFSEIARALDIPTIILVPRVGLVNDSFESLVGNESHIGVGFKKHKVCRISSIEGGKSSQQLQNYLDKNNGEFSGVIVTTYQSLNAIRRNDRELFSFLINGAGFIVSDEAHRSLGVQTQETKDFLLEEGVSEDDISDQNDIEKVIEEHISGKIHLLTTATPKLIAKDVRDNVPTIYSATMQEVSDEGDLIIPKLCSIGTAILNLEDYDGSRRKIRQQDLSGPLTKYITSDGGFVYQENVNRYIEEKDRNDGYLPGVGFCTTVEQADFITNYLNSKGVRAIRCTSASKGYKSQNVSDIEAKRMLEYNEIDIVVTCTKVGEGWDVPTLRCAMWFSPTESPSKNLQGNGRITRVISEQQENIYRRQIGESYRRKTSENTIIIEPEIWEVNRFIRNNQGAVDNNVNESDGSSGGGEGGTSSGNILENLSTIPGSHAMMYDMGEIDWERLKGYGVDITKVERILTIEEIIERHILELDKLGINDTEGLVNFGPNKYKDEFGYRTGGKILGNSIGDMTIPVLKKIGDKIGFTPIVEEILTPEQLIEKHIGELKELGITTINDLIELTGNGYRLQFGHVTIGKILSRTIRAVTHETLRELGTELGFIEEGVDKLKKSHKKELEDEGIMNEWGLLKYGPTKYKKRFGLSIATNIFGETVTDASIDFLKRLSSELELESVLISHKRDLNAEGVKTVLQLTDYGNPNYSKKYGTSMIGFILDDRAPAATRIILEKIGRKIGLEDISLSEQHKEELKLKGVETLEQLLEFGPKWYVDSFGKILMKRILNKIISGTIKIENLKELGRVIGLKEKTIGEITTEHKIDLKSKGIIDMESLMEYGVGAYTKNYGILIARRILGGNFSGMNIKGLSRLGENLGFSEKPIEEIIKELKTELESEGIVNKDTLLNFGIKNIYSKIGVVKIGRILGYLTKSLKKDDLVKLGDILFDENTK